MREPKLIKYKGKRQRQKGKPWWLREHEQTRQPVLCYAVLGHPPQAINIATIDAYSERHHVPLDYRGDRHYTQQQIDEMVALDRAAGLAVSADTLACAIEAEAKIFAVPREQVLRENGDEPDGAA